ncbi:two-component regulator propeller domain-containing protein [Echinicola shivajiensis]|uniref:two-component regulator propeller domain-containing protein n=1 Tax=Echinicola shivajiensis TaxID=1035916 RepID=UPI001BFCB054|nr:two-component regulator propeller domain-containing protein [Echinicola shivajiensis]
MSIKSILFLFLALIAWGKHLTAQQYVLQFKSLNNKDGLSDTRVTDVLQASNGIIWIGNKITIDRYDGENTSSYYLDRNNTINQLIEDSHNNIWAATNKGIYFYDAQINQFKKLTVKNPDLQTIINQRITCIGHSSDGFIYFGSNYGYLVKFLPDSDGSLVKEKFEIIQKPEKITGYATAIVQDAHDNLWIGSTDGTVFKYRNDTSEIYLDRNENHTYINDIAPDQSGNLWVATNGNGLLKIDADGQILSHFKNDSSPEKTINNNMVISILAENNHLWIGTDGGGLNLYEIDKGAFSYFFQNSTTNSIADNSILSIKKGLGDNIFLATVHGGLSVLKSKFNITNISSSQLGFSHVDQQGSVILEDNKGDIWLSAGREGLLRYNRQTQVSKLYTDHPNRKNDLNGGIVLSLCQDRKDRLWIGTFRGGLSVLDLRSDKFIPIKSNKQFNSVFSIAEDKEGNIWVGHRMGITIFDMNLRPVQDLSPSSKLIPLSNGTKSIFQDINGDMWAGTISGLFRYEMKNGILKKHKYLYNENDSLSISNNHILSIGKTKDLSILVGTYGFGLNKYNRENDNFERIKLPNKRSSIIQGILMDDSDNIWLSTNSGLTKIDPSGNITDFDESNGIYPFTGGKAHLSHDGKILMAGSYGLSFFDPKDLRPSDPNFKINFTAAISKSQNTSSTLSSTSIYNYQNNPNKQINIAPENILLTINYACSDPILSEQVNYAYMLKGLSDSWNNIGHQKSLSFSNLKPGEYTLYVKAANKNGAWSPHISYVKIKVLPTLLESRWFQICLIVLLILVLLSLYRWRLSSLTKQRQNLKILLDEKAQEVKKQQSKIAQNKIDLLNIEKNNQALKQKQLKDELSFKTGELTNLTLRTVHKHDLLNEIKASLRKELKNNPIKKENLKVLIEHIDDSIMLDKDWDQFYELFNQIHPGFIKTLKSNNPSLSERDVKLCALIYMGFTSQNMATLFGISLSSIKVARHRLRKKLELNENDTIVDFLKVLIP